MGIFDFLKNSGRRKPVPRVSIRVVEDSEPVDLTEPEPEPEVEPEVEDHREQYNLPLHRNPAAYAEMSTRALRAQLQNSATVTVSRQPKHAPVRATLRTASGGVIKCAARWSPDADALVIGPIRGNATVTFWSVQNSLGRTLAFGDFDRRQVETDEEITIYKEMIEVRK